MTTDIKDQVIDSTAVTEAEVIAARVEAEESLIRERIKTGDEVSEGKTLPGTVKPMTYVIPDSDKASWVMGWELKADRDGNEYGIPRRMPRQQLGLWLQKKREKDGGRRFTIDQPERIAAEPQFECFIGECSKRVYERVWLVQHIRINHPVEAQAYTEFITKLEKAIAADNPKMAKLVDDLAARSDDGLHTVTVKPQPRDEAIDVTAGAPIVSTMGIKTEPEVIIYRCEVAGCARFFDSSQALNMHYVHPKADAAHKAMRGN